MKERAETVTLRLPGTSANLGPAFDTAAVALEMHLTVRARRAAQFSLEARGRDAAACGRMEGNLILETYAGVLRECGLAEEPLELSVENGIPLGMGCGSSAAARLAGILLAVELGGAEWDAEQVVAYATALEGHPDNVTACWLGGMTVSAMSEQRLATGAGWSARVRTARIDVPAAWRAAVLIPREPVLTETSRQVLPERYSRADVVENLQRSSLLTGAFALGDGELLREAMRDALHQPYRVEMCPLLKRIERIAGVPGVLGAALSGAGPALLLVTDRSRDARTMEAALREAVGEDARVETLVCEFAAIGAGASVVRTMPAMATAEPGPGRAE